MYRFISLTKVILISSFGISAVRARAARDRLVYLKMLGIGAAVAAGFGPLIALYVKLLNQGFDLLAPIGQAGAILTLGIVLVSAMIFFFGIFYIINTFYFAEDAESLLPLPLRAWQVLGARFTVVLCYEYLTELPFLLPPILVFGIKSGAPPLYWLYAVIGFLALPLVPLTLASLLSIVVMRFTSLGRRRDLLKVIGGIFAMVLAVGVQMFFSQSGPNAADPQFIQELFTKPDSLTNLLSRIFPSAKYLVLGLVYSGQAAGLLNLLVFIGLSLLSVVLVWWVGDKLYYAGLIGSSEVASKRKALTESAFQRLVKPSPPLIAYLMKEIRLVLRTPAYFMNCILINLLMPLFLVLPFFLQGRRQAGTMPWEGLTAFPRFEVILIAIVSAISVFVVMSNAITATSLSREGKQFFVSKYLPLPYHRQIQAKLLSGLIFGGIGIGLMVATVVYLLDIRPALAGTCFILALAAIAPILEIGLLIDIHRPKLDWDNEQKAVKQNLNTILTMLIGLVPAGGMTYLAIRYIDTVPELSLLILGGYGVPAVILYFVLLRRGAAKYQELEGWP